MWLFTPYWDNHDLHFTNRGAKAGEIAISWYIQGRQGRIWAQSYNPQRYSSLCPIMWLSGQPMKPKKAQGQESEPSSEKKKNLKLKSKFENKRAKANANCYWISKWKSISSHRIEQTLHSVVLKKSLLMAAPAPSLQHVSLFRQEEENTSYLLSVPWHRRMGVRVRNVSGTAWVRGGLTQYDFM